MPESIRKELFRFSVLGGIMTILVGVVLLFRTQSLGAVFVFLFGGAFFLFAAKLKAEASSSPVLAEAPAYEERNSDT